MKDVNPPSKKLKHKPPKLITCGGGDPDILKEIISLTSLKSVKMIKAVGLYHVNGFDENTLRLMGYDVPNFRRALVVVEEVAQKVERIKIKAWAKFNYE